MAHAANVVTDLLRPWRREILEQPPYSPDMSPFDYDLFAKMKEPLRGIRYNTRQVIILAVTVGLSTEVDALMVYDAFHKFGRRWYTGGEIILKECKCVYLR
jgi:hypothetical protein